jgi:hypothetical protein
MIAYIPGNQSDDADQRISIAPRFPLRKRPAADATCEPNRPQKIKLTTVNSDFLSGLFADVEAAAHDDSRLHDCVAFKKSRISKSHSISRCMKSYTNLHDAALISPVDHTPFDRVDSLQLQLNSLAFPHLPATVSVSSCTNSLTRNMSDLQSSLTETHDREAYGWFVEMEEPKGTADTCYYGSSSRLQDLAFSAPTAPNAENQDDEVEWAKAADTVDDVLGDFF